MAGCLLAVADSPGTFREQASVYCQVAQSAIKVPLPEIHQPDYYSCGTAASMSIGSYFGVGPEDIEAWKSDLCTRTDTGTDVEPIVEYARNKLMLDVTLVERDMTDEQLRASLDAGKPVICPIQAYGEPAEYEKLNENGHYVVAIGYDRVNVYFMDPKLTGRRGFLSWPEFHRRWHENIGTDSNPDVRSRLGIVIGPKHSPMSLFRPSQADRLKGSAAYATHVFLSCCDASADQPCTVVPRWVVLGRACFRTTPGRPARSGAQSPIPGKERHYLRGSRDPRAYHRQPDPAQDPRLHP